jgi:hypothetical protein
MTTYRYSLQLRRDRDGQTLEHVPLAPDWSAALEWAHFSGARRGLLPPVMADGSGSIAPIWHAELGAPYVSAFRATVPGSATVFEIPRTYVRPYAQAEANRLVEEKVLEPGETFQYVVNAFAASSEPVAATAASGFTVEAVDQPLPLQHSTLAGFEHHAVATPPTHADDPPVFVPDDVIDSVQRHAERTPDVESGGALIGRLHRDPSIPEIFVEVTAFIPAPHTESTSTKLTFTGDTWAAVRGALALRQRDESLIGWSHVHVDWCRLRNCPLERRKQCTATNAFFSPEDIHLMSTVFPRAFHVGLLLSESHQGFTPSLFGWRHGMVVHRGYHRMPATGLARHRGNDGSDEGRTHAT